MGVEIERKFLVDGEEWRELGEKTLLRQGYLSSDPNRVVRVRMENDAAYLTIKGKSQGAVRREWEYEIPARDAEELLDALCEKPLIEKYRHRIRHAGLIWEVDEFLGANAGLVVAEVELSDESQEFSRPAWVAEEVTADPRYFNSSLQKHPFSTW